MNQQRIPKKGEIVYITLIENKDEMKITHVDDVKKSFSCESVNEKENTKLYNLPFDRIIYPTWEMFMDDSYFHLWAVRRIGDKSFNSQALFHFAEQEDAKQLKKLLEKSK